MTIRNVLEETIPRPVLWPVSYDSASEFWEGAKRHELIFQKCKECGKWLHLPRPMCPACNSTEIEWVQSSGKGSVFSHVTYHQSADPAYKAPYAVVLVELEEGMRLVSNMTDCLPIEIEIGMPVEVVFDDIAEDLTLPRFKKVG